MSIEEATYPEIAGDGSAHVYLWSSSTDTLLYEAILYSILVLSCDGFRVDSEAGQLVIHCQECTDDNGYSHYTT